jgi:hypothetical protein
MKSLGLIAVFILLASLTYVQFKWGPDSSKTFSRLVAQKRSSIIYYFSVFVAFLVVFSIFMTSSFIPQFNLAGWFAWIYFLGIISQLICVVVPETGGTKTKIHLIAAGIMSASALIQIVLLLLLAHLSVPSVIVCVTGLFIMILIWLAIFLKHRLIKYELGLQSIYFTSYLGTILFVSYVA